MSIQSDPPITLDPSQDVGHQLAFINQNFQSIATFLNGNSFKIVSRGTYVLTRPGGTSIQTDLVPHGLQYIPTLLFNYEQTTTEPGVWKFGTTVGRLNTSTGVINEITGISVDSTNLIFKSIAPSSNPDFASTRVFTFKYFLLRETANS